MKITPVAAAPRPVESSSSNTSGRAAAIAFLQASSQPAVNQSQVSPVPNANQVSPEDVIKSKAPEQGQAASITDDSQSVEAPEALEAKPEETPLSSQYAQLAKRERMLRQQARDLKIQQDAFKAAQEALRAPQAPQVDASQYVDRKRLSEDPLSVLSELGLSYDKLTELAMGSNVSPEQRAYQEHIAKLEAKIAAIEEGQTKTQKSIEEQQTNAYKQAVDQISQDAKRLVYTDPKYEMIKANNAHKDVVELIEETFKNGLDDERQKGYLMSVEEAADLIEDYMTEEAEKYLKVPKIQKRYASSQAAPAATVATKPGQPVMKTLSNQMSGSKQLTIRQRAILAAEGKLNDVS